MWGLYNGQQRPLTSKKDTKLFIIFFWIVFSVITNNLVQILFSGSGVFLELLQGAGEHRRVGKVILKSISLNPQYEKPQRETSQQDQTSMWETLQPVLKFVVNT